MFSLESMDIRVEKVPGNKDWLVQVSAQTSLQDGKLLGFARLRDEQIVDLHCCLKDVVGKMLDAIEKKENH